MKIKCDDELPLKAGTYYTDLGSLMFSVYDRDKKIWYARTETPIKNFVVTNYNRVNPTWWIKTDET